MTQQTANNKNKQNLKKYLVFGIMIAVFIGCMWLIFAPSAKDKEVQQEGVGFNSDIPDPKGAGIVGDKKKAYEQEQQRLRQEEKMRSLQDYTFMVGETDENSEEYQRQLAMAPKPVEYQEYLNDKAEGKAVGSWQSRRANSVQASGSAYSDLTNTLNSFYEESEKDAEKERMQEEIEELKAMVEAKNNTENGLDEQIALLEKSFELASRFNQTSDPAATTQQTAETTSSSGRRNKVEPVSQPQRSAVSSLARQMTDQEFVEYATQPRNFGFNTVADAGSEKAKNTISAVVHGDQTLINGQAIRLRTTEAMYAGSRLIPRNTIITGLCRIGGERLEISVSSIEYEGTIIPVALSVYDSDGQQGIYIPGSMEITAIKEIAGNMGQSLGTTINLNQQNAGEQLLTDLGRGAIQGTSQYISKKAREIKVSLKAGYRLFLLPDTNA